MPQSATVIRVVAVGLLFGLMLTGCTLTPQEQTAVTEALNGEAAIDDKTDGTTEEAADVTIDNSDSLTFSGTVLAGSSAPLLDFNQADYEKALLSGKVILLYFYADWCPICRAEVPNLYAAFNQLRTDQVIGFRVNFNDGETDDDEKALARAHGVAYQHTKVAIKNGQRVLKSPETWNQERYVDEINSLLK